MGAEVEFLGGWYPVFRLGEDGKLVLESAPRIRTSLSVSGPYFGDVIPFDTIEEGPIYTVIGKSHDAG